MATVNTISENYMSKIRFFFTYDWILLGSATLLLFYYLINYFSKDSFIIFNIASLKALIVSFPPFLVFIIKFSISLKVKTRLVIEIIEEPTYFMLTVYDKSVVKIDKPIINFLSRKTDFFLDRLFSPTIGTIHLTPNQCEKFILVTKNKKYYLVPTLFEYAIQF
jgi:hypothetical protein